MQFCKELQKADFVLQHANIKDESHFLNYRNAFFFLRNHIHVSATDGFSLIKNQLDDLEKITLVESLNKLRNPFYDIEKLEEILSTINMIFAANDSVLKLRN